jgi:cell division protein FtsL
MKKKLLTILVAVVAIVGVSQIYNAAKPYNSPKSPTDSDTGGGRGSADQPF